MGREDGFVRFWGYLGAGLILLGGLLPVHERLEGFWVWTLQAWGHAGFVMVYVIPLFTGILVICNLRLPAGKARGVSNTLTGAALFLAIPLGTASYLAFRNRVPGIHSLSEVLLTVQIPTAGVLVAAANHLRRLSYSHPIPKLLIVFGGISLILSLLIPFGGGRYYQLPPLVLMFRWIEFNSLEMLAFALMGVAILIYGVLAILTLVPWANPMRIHTTIRILAYVFLGLGPFLHLIGVSAEFGSVLEAAKETTLTFGCVLVLGVGLVEGVGVTQEPEKY